MKVYKLTSIQRTLGMTQEDANRIGKRCTIESIEVGKPAILRYYDLEARAILTSTVQAVDDKNDVVEFQTRNTRYRLDKVPHIEKTP